MTSFQPPATPLRHDALAALCLTDPASKVDATLRLGERPARLTTPHGVPMSRSRCRP